MISAATARHRCRSCMGERTTQRSWNSERRFCTCQRSQPIGGKWEPRFHPGVFVGMLKSSPEAVVVTEQGLAIKTRAANVRRIPESERWDADRTLGIRAVPGLRMAVTMHSIFKSEWRGSPEDIVPRTPGEVLKENKVARTYVRRVDFEQWGLSEGCPGCRYLRTGQGRQQAHSEARRRRIEALLKGDSSGAARLAAGDE